MGESKLEKNSKKKYFWNNGGIAIDYGDFEKIKPESFVAIRLKGYLEGPGGFKNYTISHYVSRKVIDKSTQEVILKHTSRTDPQVYSGQVNEVTKYHFPLEGEITLKEFLDKEIK
ncbi:hypothetical protein GW932_04755 [archaeon]|nr:hypothetical protein [archaeon]